MGSEVENYVIERLRPCKQCIYAYRLCESGDKEDLRERLWCYGYAQLEQAFKCSYWLVPEESEYQFFSYLDCLVLHAAVDLQRYPFCWDSVSPYTVNLLIKHSNIAIEIEDDSYLLLYRNHFVIVYHYWGVYAKHVVIFPYDSSKVNRLCYFSARVCRDVLEMDTSQVPHDILNVISDYVVLYDFYEKSVWGWENENY
jgi:hypothetical protein